MTTEGSNTSSNATPTTSPGAADDHHDNPNTTTSPSASLTSRLSFTTKHMSSILAFTPCTRMTLSSIRICNKAWRSVIEGPVPKDVAPFGSKGEMFLSKHTTHVVCHHHARQHNHPTTDGEEATVALKEDAVRNEVSATPDKEAECDGASATSATLLESSSSTSFAASYELYSVNPVGRKFSDRSAESLVARCQATARLSTSSITAAPAPPSVVAATLGSLRLHHAVITHECFRFLGQISSLQHLELVVIRGIKTLAPVSGIPTLRVLDVQMCDLDPNGLDGLFLPHLRRLLLKRCPKLESLNGIAPETISNLEELRIEDCSMLTDDGCNEAFALLRGPPHPLHTLGIPYTSVSTALSHLSPSARLSLKHLDVRNTAVNSIALASIADDLKNLQALRLETCEAVTSLAFVEKLQSLELLDVSGIEEAFAIESIGALHKTLTSLRIADMMGANFMSFLSQLTHLQYLDISNTGAADVDMDHISVLHELTVLYIFGCSAVTSINVLRNCSALRKLFASGTGLTDDGIRRVPEFPVLEELDVSATEVSDVNFLSRAAHLHTINVFGSVHELKGVEGLFSLKHRLHVVMDMTLTATIGGTSNEGDEYTFD